MINLVIYFFFLNSKYSVMIIYKIIYLTFLFNNNEIPKQNITMELEKVNSYFFQFVKVLGWFCSGIDMDVAL